jgi:hypothetical protein
MAEEAGRGRGRMVEAFEEEVGVIDRIFVVLVGDFEQFLLGEFFGVEDGSLRFLLLRYLPQVVHE